MRFQQPHNECLFHECDTNIEGNENINIINICNTKDKVTKTIKKNACKNKKYNNTSENKIKIKTKFENKDKKYKNQKHYSDMIRSKLVLVKKTKNKK